MSWRRATFLAAIRRLGASADIGCPYRRYSPVRTPNLPTTARFMLLSVLHPGCPHRRRARSAPDALAPPTSPHSGIDRASVRRLAVLKNWVDQQGLSSPPGFAGSRFAGWCWSAEAAPEGGAEAVERVERAVGPVGAAADELELRAAGAGREGDPLRLPPAVVAGHQAEESATARLRHLRQREDVVPDGAGEQFIADGWRQRAEPLIRRRGVAQQGRCELLGDELIDRLVRGEHVEMTVADLGHVRAGPGPAVPVADPVEHADPGGGQRDRQRYRHVLVDAGAERQADAGQEVAPDHLVPHARGDVEQHRAVGDG